MPVAWLLDPAICEPVALRIAVDDRGYTRPAAGPPNAAVCLKSDENRFQELFIEPISDQPQGGSFGTDNFAGVGQSIPRSRIGARMMYT